MKKCTSLNEGRNCRGSFLFLFTFAFFTGLLSCTQGTKKSTGEDAGQLTEIPAIGSLETILKESPSDLRYVNDSNWLSEREGFSQTPEATPVGYFNGKNETMDSRRRMTPASVLI